MWPETGELGTLKASFGNDLLLLSLVTVGTTIRDQRRLKYKHNIRHVTKAPCFTAKHGHLTRERGLNTQPLGACVPCAVCGVASTFQKAARRPKDE